MLLADGTPSLPSPTLPLDYDMEVIEASASTGSNVNEVFVSLGRTILSTNRAVSRNGLIDR